MLQVATVDLRCTRVEKVIIHLQKVLQTTGNSPPLFVSPMEAAPIVSGSLVDFRNATYGVCEDNAHLFTSKISTWHPQETKAYCFLEDRLVFHSQSDPGVPVLLSHFLQNLWLRNSKLCI